MCDAPCPIGTAPRANIAAGRAYRQRGRMERPVQNEKTTAFPTETIMNRPLRIAALAAAATTLTAAPALADNHFILEVDAGLTTAIGHEDDGGRALGGTFGFGGRIPGSKPAYYFIGRIGASENSAQGALSHGSPTLDSGRTEWALGARMYLPITDRLRAMLQVSLGETYEHTEIGHVGGRPLTVEEEMFSVFADAGLQYRFTNHFSLGGVVNLGWHPEDRADLVARSAGIETDGTIGQMRAGVTTTFHF